MFIIIILIVTLIEILFVPLPNIYILSLLVTLLAIIVVFGILFPPKQRGFGGLPQKRLQEILGIYGLGVGFNHDPEKLTSSKFSLDTRNPNFVKGVKLIIPFSYESNVSGFVDFVYQGLSGKGILNDLSEIIVRADAVLPQKRPFLLRGSIIKEREDGLKVERFFFDRSIGSLKGAIIQGYVVLLHPRGENGIYRFPPIKIDLTQRRESPHQDFALDSFSAPSPVE